MKITLSVIKADIGGIMEKLKQLDTRFTVRSKSEEIEPRKVSAGG